MLLRSFPPRVEQLARRWRDEVLTEVRWERVEEAVSGAESQPFWVRSEEGDGGLAKPGTGEPSAHRHPRAAHEKIAADLAFDLGLPVPPVILWERPTAERRAPRLVSISALAFPQANTWRGLPAPVAERLLPRLSPGASALAVFDSWVDNVDRQNARNLLLSEDVTVSPPVLRSAYLDFANSLSFPWDTSRGWTREEGVALYPSGVALDVSVMRETLLRVERFPFQVLREIVKRILMRLLSAPHRELILEGLVYRQSTLRRMMAVLYPGIT